MNQTQERLGRVEMNLKNRSEHKELDSNRNKCEKNGLLISYQRQSAQDYVTNTWRASSWIFFTFNGRMDPQLFLEWLQYMDKYFT